VIEFGPVARYADGRPPAWFDDDFDAYPSARDSFLDGRRGLPTELIGVNPRTGLTDEHFEALRAWTRTVVP
jgi:hypothetical protein